MRAFCSALKKLLTILDQITEALFEEIEQGLGHRLLAHGIAAG